MSQESLEKCHHDVDLKITILTHFKKSNKGNYFLKS